MTKYINKIKKIKKIIKLYKFKIKFNEFIN